MLTQPRTTPMGAWGDLAPRAASALFLGPVALACVWAGGWGWVALLALAALLLLREWHIMCRAGAIRPAFYTAGLLYIGLATASLWWLRADPTTGRATVLLLLIVVWASDIGAYLAGRWIGGPRLAPAISPGKTWSGAIGGLAGAIASALALALVWPHGAATAVATLAVLLSIASQLGDLAESAVKRACGVKDSGNLIPGHGGLLDRVDGILLAAPVLAATGLLLGRGLVPWN